MEENELEEGEACSIQEDDASIDPDVALSYIDAKIQDVLGHFQKDFEAGVSAENLGAKFGGYGSFLPAYQRSPSILSHPRSPQRVPNHSTPRSPCNATVEAAHQNPTVATNTSVSSINNSVPKAPSLDGVKKKETCTNTPTFRECTPQYDLAHTISKSNDQKILKVRIKVGSDNALPRPNAAIYSDMGLEYSPSLSLEDSPGESGGFSPEPRDAPDESPATIYQIMTCFPVLDGYVLSPLPESLLHLMENERPYFRGSKLTIRKTSLETYDVLSGDTVSSRGKVYSGRKTRSVEKHVKSSEMKSLDGNGVHDATGIRKKEIDVETPAVREFVSSAPNVSTLSSSEVADERAGQLSSEAGKGCYITREPNKVTSKVRSLSPDLAKDDPLVGVTSLDTRHVSRSGNGFQPLKEKVNFRTVPFDKPSEERKQIKCKDASFGPASDCGVTEKNCDTLKFEANGSKSRKEMITESDEPTKVKGSQEFTLHEQNSEKLVYTKDHDPMAKGKSASQINGMPPVELLNENSKTVSSVLPKEKKKGAHSKVDYYENKQNLLGPNKESSRTLNQEGYKDAVGDLKTEHVGKRIDTMESANKDKPRDLRTEYEKNSLLFGEKTKERSDGKKRQNSPLSEAPGKCLEITPLIANGPTSEAPPAPLVHLIQENWVCCDRCQKWRLLPYGTNPDLLPKKWLCTMLTWLPGMNKCTISEEETTRALHALYQAPTSLENHAANGASASVAVSTDAQHVDQNLDPALHIASTFGKKKHSQKDISHAPSDLTNLSNSVKKSQQASVKSRSLNDVNHVTPHSSSRSSFQHVNKSTELNVDKDTDRQKEKYKMVERDFTGGEFPVQNGKTSKSKGKRDIDQDGFRSSKKTKAEVTLCADEDWHSDHDFSGRVASVNHNGLPTKMINKNSTKDDDNASFKNSKCNSHDSFSGSRKKLNPDMQVSSNGYCKEQLSTFDEGNFIESVAKKRKVKERQEGNDHPEKVVGNKLLADERASVKEEMSENESRKEKRSKVLKAEGRDSVTDKVDDKINKKGRPIKVLLLNNGECALDRMEEENKGMSENEQKVHPDGVAVSERNYNGLDSLQRDLPCVHPPTAATSSSSKVSGSRKSKSNFQESRGSPVESVSSSPLRISNTEKRVNKKNGGGKDKDKSYAVVHCESLDACRPVDCVVRDPLKGLPEYQDRVAAQMLVSKEKGGIYSKACNNMHRGIPLLELEQNYSATGAVNSSVQHNKYHNDFRSNTHGQDEEKLNNHCHSSGSTQQKSGKNSSQPREKHKNSKSEVNKGKVKISGSCSVRENICSTKNGNAPRYNADMHSNQHSTYHENVRDGYNRLEKKDGKKRESVGRQLGECRRDNHLNFGSQEILETAHMLSKRDKDIQTKDNEGGTISSKGGKSYPEYDSQTVTFDEEDKSSNHFLSDRTGKLETTHGRGKSKPVSHSGDRLDPQIQDSRMVLSDKRGDRPDAPFTDAASGEAPKVLKEPRMLDSQSGQHWNCLRQPTPNRLDAPSPVRRDSNPDVAVLLKEARDLKHTANRLKCEGLNNESTGLYFEAALKFLYVAFLLETSGAESGKHGETTQSIAMYSDTAKLCDFCAHEYEKLKEMAGAALAYKCMEVAYMKVIFSKHSCAYKDRHELQAALQMVSTGESPSSSASDVDNLNNLSTVDKAVPTKGASSPQVAGHHVISARSRLSFLRVLNYVQDVNYAMEASRKSHCALNTAVNASPEELRHGPEIIASVRQILDLSFHDVEGLLRFVRLSINSISR